MTGRLEALRIACGIENRGIVLYTRAAKLAKSDEMRALLASLAEDEGTHLKQFLRMCARYCPEAEASGEEDALCSAAAADIAFPGGLFAVAAGGYLDDEKKLIEYAAECEKNSIRYYSELLNETYGDDMKRTLSDIIAQEQGHLAQLERRIR